MLFYGSGDTDGAAKAFASVDRSSLPKARVRPYELLETDLAAMKEGRAAAELLAAKISSRPTGTTGGSCCGWTGSNWQSATRSFSANSPTECAMPSSWRNSVRQFALPRTICSSRAGWRPDWAAPFSGAAAGAGTGPGTG
ncbi:MAG: hypothetical protein L6W00_06375 [Lentisphaeria bacterium]|nr:MAG: hypothetical protein L6W00_06375 [Lentisphaeria bacterium]